LKNFVYLYFFFSLQEGNKMKRQTGMFILPEKGGRGYSERGDASRNGNQPGWGALPGDCRPAAATGKISLGHG